MSLWFGWLWLLCDYYCSMPLTDSPCIFVKFLWQENMSKHIFVSQCLQKQLFSNDQQTCQVLSQLTVGSINNQTCHSEFLQVTCSNAMSNNNCPSTCCNSSVTDITHKHVFSTSHVLIKILWASPSQCFSVHLVICPCNRHPPNPKENQLYIHNTFEKQEPVNFMMCLLKAAILLGLLPAQQQTAD